jgi:hypothetical protein
MEPRHRLNHDKRIQLPAHALFIGASMSGKTRLATHLLANPHLFYPRPATILFYYDQFQSRYMELKTGLASAGIKLELRRGCSVTLDELPNYEQPTILLIDDATEQTASSSDIARIATNGRHKNISLWLIWHSLYSKHAASRLIQQNIGLFFFLPSVRLESQLRTFGAQLGMSRLLLDAYHAGIEDETEYRYLLVDLSQATPALLRLRSRIHEPIQFAYTRKL